MPRHRVISLAWLIGAVLLLGAWGHSLLRKSHLQLRSQTVERHLEAGIAAGSLKIHLRAEHPLRSPGITLVSDRWLAEQDPWLDPFAPAPPPPEEIPPPYHFGRFHASDGQLEVPLWFVILFETALFLPLYLRALEHGRHSEAALLPPVHDEGPDTEDALHFKLY